MMRDGEGCSAHDDREAAERLASPLGTRGSSTNTSRLKVRSSSAKILDVKSWIGKLSESVRTATRLTMSEKSCTPVYRMVALMGTSTWAEILSQTCLTCGPIPSGHTNMSIDVDDVALTVL
jgi:hypothetical protein